MCGDLLTPFPKQTVQGSKSANQTSQAIFDGTFEQATILRTGTSGLTRVIVRESWSERGSLFLDAREAELVVFRRWVDFSQEALGFEPSWGAWSC